MVGGDVAGGDAEAVPDGIAEAVTGRQQVVVGSRSIRHEVGVAVERHALDGVRQAVQDAVDGERLEGDREVVPWVGEGERCEQAVGDEAADPVVGADEDVGASSRRALLPDPGADVAEGNHFDVDRDARRRLEIGGDAVECPGAGLVRPDHQRLIHHRGGRGGRGGGRRRGGGRGGSGRGGRGGGGRLGGGRGGTVVAAGGNEQVECDDQARDDLRTAHVCSSHRGEIPPCRPGSCRGCALGSAGEW
jgi:hypothetical protein